MIPPEVRLHPRQTETTRDVSTISGGYRVDQLNTGRPDATALLRVEELQSIYRMLRVIRVDLAHRAAALLRPADFDRLGPHLDLITTKKVMPHQASAAHQVFLGGLLSPGASNPELRTHAMLCRQVGNHLNYAMDRLGVHPAEFPGQVEVHPLLFDAFRRGDPDAVAAATDWMTEVGQNAAITLARQLAT